MGGHRRRQKRGQGLLRVADGRRAADLRVHVQRPEGLPEELPEIFGAEAARVDAIYWNTSQIRFSSQAPARSRKGRAEAVAVSTLCLFRRLVAATAWGPL